MIRDFITRRLRKIHIQNGNIAFIINMMNINKGRIVVFMMALIVVTLMGSGCGRKSPEGLEATPNLSASAVSKDAVTNRIVQLPVKLVESSGLAIIDSGKIWSHNDSGNENKLYCFSPAGILLRTITISNATNVDWEDLATDSQNRIYISDTGNNFNNRNDQTIYRIPDPETIAEGSVNAEIIRFSFEDQSSFPPPASQWNYDLEAIVWHNDSIFMFTKDRTSPFAGYTKMYKIAATPGTHVAKASGSRYLGNSISSARVTAADINRTTGDLALLVQERLIVFSNYTGSRFLEGKATDYKFSPMPGQAEAIVFSSDSTLYMTEEGLGSVSGFLYKILLPSR